jgi:hypothetical protein
MTPPSDPTTDLVPTSSRPRPDSGDDLENRARPSSPTLTGDELESASSDDPVENQEQIVPGTTSGTTWNPNHPNTRTAWIHVHASIQTRQLDGLWSSRTIVESIAQKHLADYRRAQDFIRSLITNGYLEERPYPGFTVAHHHSTQVRLVVDDPKEGPS